MQSSPFETSNDCQNEASNESHSNAVDLTIKIDEGEFNDDEIDNGSCDCDDHCYVDAHDYLKSDTELYTDENTVDSLRFDGTQETSGSSIYFQPLVLPPNEQTIMNGPSTSKQIQSSRKKCSYTIINFAITCTEPGCEENFETWPEVRDHVAQEHKLPPYMCLVAGCGQRFDEK